MEDPSEEPQRINNENIKAVIDQLRDQADRGEIDFIGVVTIRNGGTASHTMTGTAEPNRIVGCIEAMKVDALTIVFSELSPRFALATAADPDDVQRRN